MSAEILRRSPLFRTFTPVGVEIFSRIATPRIVLARAPLFQEGGPANALFLVAEGRFQILVKGADGQEMVLARLGVGEHMSEMSLLSSGSAVHMCSALAEVDSRVLEITSADFVELIRVKPQACVKLLLAAAQSLGQKVAACRDPLRHLPSLFASP